MQVEIVLFFIYVYCIIVQCQLVTTYKYMFYALVVLEPLCGIGIGLSNHPY